MPVSASILAELLPSDAGEWEPIAGGESGAWVVVDRSRQRFAKAVSSARVPELAAERDRSLWLADTGIPCPRVLDWRESDAGACLITQAVPGVPASTLEADALSRAWPSVVTAVRALHSLPADRCPFDRTLSQMMPLARASAAEGRIVIEFLPRALQSTAPTLCLPNVLVDPATDAFTAFIDLGRLGTADPYGDIALLLATAGQTWSDDEVAQRANQTFVQIYGTELDPERQDFYLRMDPLTW